jgi:hypothetical protein
MAALQANRLAPAQACCVTREDPVGVPGSSSTTPAGLTERSVNVKLPIVIPRWYCRRFKKKDDQREFRRRKGQ